jgi:coiled-coil domain-containing protein 55
LDNKPDDTNTNHFDPEVSGRSPKESIVGSERAKSLEQPSANLPEQAKSVEQPPASILKDSTTAGSTEENATSNASQTQQNTQPAKVIDDHYKRTDDALAAARARALARKRKKEQQLLEGQSCILQVYKNCYSIAALHLEKGVLVVDVACTLYKN